MTSNIIELEQTEPDSDRAIQSKEEDDYGYAEIAQKLAPSLVAATASDGLVIGIEGKWGSGKTSLLNLLVSELQASEDESLQVIVLPPWLHGNADHLGSSLFAQMLPALEKEELSRSEKANKRLWTWSKGQRRRTNSIADAVRRYAAKTARGSAPLLKLGGVFFPFLEQTGSAVELGGRYLEQIGGPESVAELKAQVASFLEKSDLKFVVLLDDLDRLEPHQTTEVVRLVRSVADFPRVVYCLCYDRDVLSHALETGLSVEDGHAYLQKIVQQTFSMPLPEPFALRIALREKLSRYYQSVNGHPLSDEEASNLEAIVDLEGQNLEVPRDITLVLNAVKFSYPEVRHDVYFPDVCWIQMVRAKRPKLHRWIESYLATRSVVTTTSAFVGESGQRKMGEELKELLPEYDDVMSTHSIWRIKDYIPGIEPNDDAAKCVFQSMSRNEIADIIEKKRIGSPVHSQVYFSFAIPKIHMPDSQWNALEALASGTSEKLTNKLVELANQKRPIGGTWFSYVIDRLDDQKLEKTDEEHLVTWALAVSDSMDSVLKADNERGAFTVTTAQQTVFMMQRLLKVMRQKNEALTKKTIEQIFNQSPSLSWLVGDLLRRELFDHGIVGDRPSPQDRSLLVGEIDEIRRVVKDRLKSKNTRKSIPSFPELSGFLYGWRDLVGTRSPKAWVKAHVSDDVNFLTLLLELRGWAQSTKVYYPLQKSAVEVFLDWEKTLDRVAGLRNSKDKQIRELVEQVDEAIKCGNDRFF